MSNFAGITPANVSLHSGIVPRWPALLAMATGIAGLLLIGFGIVASDDDQIKLGGCAVAQAFSIALALHCVGVLILAACFSIRKNEKLLFWIAATINWSSISIFIGFAVYQLLHWLWLLSL